MKKQNDIAQNQSIIHFKSNFSFNIKSNNIDNCYFFVTKI